MKIEEIQKYKIKNARRKELKKILGSNKNQRNFQRGNIAFITNDNKFVRARNGAYGRLNHSLIINNNVLIAENAGK